jgi:hypothetical protein
LKTEDYVLGHARIALLWRAIDAGEKFAALSNIDLS